MTQWRDRITQFLPNAKIGKIQQNTIDIENKDRFSNGSGSSQKEYDPKVFSSIWFSCF